MKSLLRVCLLLGTALFCGPLYAAGPDQTSPGSSHYTIGTGDLILVSVWKDEALTRQVVVLPDGKISFPLVGEVQAAGRTIEQLRSELEAKLERFVPGVTLSVIVQQVNSQVVYVIGRVTTPGRFLLTGDINVLQALAMAGGLNPFAKKGEIKIFRQEEGKTKIFPFDYDAVSTGSDLRQNITLQRGDVIVVP
ncbi:MAG: polysaccharide biosynthesis/export family protein [Desulfobacterales bacterium]